MKTTLILEDQNSPTKETIKLKLEMTEETIHDLLEKVWNKQRFELIRIEVDS